ncbi:MAG: NUDIX hydrolase [Gammaproteobacteria bacterium]|nr:NUDIX hydrolase [Gammaproteobacteria bacterium]
MNYCPHCATPMVKRNSGGRERASCPQRQCGFVHWDNPVPVVGGIVEWNNQIVLVRNVGWPTSWYGLVTGFLEAGEMPEEAILREVKEEIGLDATLESHVGMYEFYRKNQLLIIYHLRAHSGDVVVQADEIADYKWVAVEKVQPWTAGTGRALQDWLRSRGLEREMLDFSEANN